MGIPPGDGPLAMPVFLLSVDSLLDATSGRVQHTGVEQLVDCRSVVDLSNDRARMFAHARRGAGAVWAGTVESPRRAEQRRAVVLRFEKFEVLGLRVCGKF